MFQFETAGFFGFRGLSHFEKLLFYDKYVCYSTLLFKLNFCSFLKKW